MTLQKKGIVIACQFMYWILIVYLVYVQLMVVSFWIFDYQVLYGWFTRRFPDAYLINEYGSRYFTFAHYRFVQKSSGVFILLPFLAMLFLFYKRTMILKMPERLIKDIGHLAGIIADSFSNLSTAQKWILCICCFLLANIKIYFFITLPFYVDEVFNFVYFVDKGFLHTTLYSNNHVLYNLISILWWKTGMNPEISARLTSIFSGLLINIILFSITRHYFNFKTAILVLMLTGITFWANVYAVQGSAYMLVALCSLVGFISLFHFTQDPDRGYHLFTLSCILGFYCSKLFIIPFLSFILLWIGIQFTDGLQNKTITAKIFKSTTAVFLFSGLLYLPMFLWSGGDGMFLSNVARHDLVTMSPIFFESLSMMTEINSKSYLVMLGLFILVALFLRVIDRKLKLLIALNVATIISILLFALVVHVYPPSRSVVYINILFFGTLGVVIGSITPKLVTQLYQLVVIWLVVILLKGWGSIYLMNYGWQKSPGSLQDSPFYCRLNRQANCIVMYKPQLIFTDQQDTYLNFYLDLAAIREKAHLNITYDPDKMLKADMNILHQGYTTKLDEYTRVKNEEFGMILYKADPERTFSTDCIAVQ